MQTIRAILHPTDLSERSSCAFRLACSLAQAHGARPHVLHVAEHPVVVPAEGTGTGWPVRYANELTAKLLSIRPEGASIPVEHQLLFPLSPGEGWLLVGIVAEQVVRKALCSVVTVKTPLPETGPPGGDAP